MRKPTMIRFKARLEEISAQLESTRMAFEAEESKTDFAVIADSLGHAESSVDEALQDLGDLIEDKSK